MTALALTLKLSRIHTLQQSLRTLDRCYSSVTGQLYTRGNNAAAPSSLTVPGSCVRSMCTPADGGQVRLPLLLERAPDFSGTAVVDGEFKKIALQDYVGRYLVLFFYPLNFTFVCPTELVAFSDRMSEFEALNSAVVGVSTDSQFSHLAWLQQPRREGGLGGLRYPLLSDITKTVSRNYGVLLESQGVALRGLFLIDQHSVLRQLSVNDLPVGRSVDETLRLLRAFQHHEQHGEVCPANWKPGEPTIKPHPQQSRAYFEKVN